MIQEFVKTGVKDKEEYQGLQMEVISFDTEDVITTSGNDTPDIPIP